jgi:chorismate-pyruvate lyase
VTYRWSSLLTAGSAVLAFAASARAASPEMTNQVTRQMANQATATATATAWPDNFTARLEALALLQTLNAELLSHDSATLTLERWCEAHHLASPARIVAEQVQGADKPLADDQRQVLAVGPGEPVRYRRVRLVCGARVLSQADNWYVPSRLTPEMNRALETTNISFGRVVAPLQFRRRTLSATLLWRPLPDGWDTGVAQPSEAGGALQIPAELLQHRAVLTLPDGAPFSEVVETYTNEVLDFPPPAPR